MWMKIGRPVSAAPLEDALTRAFCEGRPPNAIDTRQDLQSAAMGRVAC
ncbi:hypothetical protein H5V43_17305 [Sphingobium fuliginis]|jgi:hypothetical protein|uniref:Uncharacterized protein n=1 Tax=Sphingobium fuliginis (strain ATCC 27551) TaxID=336203 RepID=A0A7M2GMC3_SPHSA|nr:hypothetical protein [Sphingobium fuliginis]QOT73910.1 hypothetical protein H5V43_17305 [Sphingobium fuliginis]